MGQGSSALDKKTNIEVLRKVCFAKYTSTLSNNSVKIYGDRIDKWIDLPSIFINNGKVTDLNERPEKKYIYLSKLRLEEKNDNAYFLRGIMYHWQQKYIGTKKKLPTL